MEIKYRIQKVSGSKKDSKDNIIFVIPWYARPNVVDNGDGTLAIKPFTLYHDANSYKQSELIVDITEGKRVYAGPEGLVEDLAKDEEPILDKEGPDSALILWIEKNIINVIRHEA